MSLTDATLTGPTRRRLLQGVGATAALLTLAGCRSAVEDAGGSPAGAGGTPRRGGVLKIGQSTDFTPSLLFTANAFGAISRLVFNTLTEYDPQTLRPRPSLATSWTVAPDGLSVNFRLRDDVKFHSGRPFTAEDVVWAIKNLQNPQRAAQLRSTAVAITSFDVKGPHELTLGLAHPVSNLFDLFEFMIIADRESVDDALTGKALIGTGPFVWKNWTPGQTLTFARNDSYWQPGKPLLDGVEIRIIPNPDALLSALRSRQIHYTVGLTTRDVAPLKSDRAFNVSEFNSGAGAIYVGVDTTVKPFDNKLVRQALSWAFDRDRIVDQVYGGLGLASALPWPKSSPAYSEAGARRYTYEPERAKTLLRQAGVGELSIPLGYLTLFQAIAQIVQYNLEQIGVHTTLQPLDPAKFQNQLINQTMPPLWVGAHGFAQVHPSTLAVSAYPFNEARNTSKFSDPVYSEVVNRAWKTPDPDSPAARAAYQQLSDILIDQQFIIDLLVLANLKASTADVHQITENLYSYLILDDAYIG